MTEEAFWSEPSKIVAYWMFLRHASRLWSLDARRTSSAHTTVPRICLAITSAGDSAYRNRSFLFFRSPSIASRGRHVFDIRESVMFSRTVAAPGQNPVESFRHASKYQIHRGLDGSSSAQKRLSLLHSCGRTAKSCDCHQIVTKDRVKRAKAAQLGEKQIQAG